jgi:RES domain
VPLADPPSPGLLEIRAIVDSWPASTRIFRAHSHLYGSAQLDERDATNFRFSAIVSSGRVVPVLYGGEDDHAAASETIFHTIGPGDSGRPRRVALDQYASWRWSSVVTTRDLSLVRLTLQGLDALEVTRVDMIEGGRLTYSATRAWSLALRETLPAVDGLWWHSRQDPGRWALMFFGVHPSFSGGIRTGDLTADTPVLPFASPTGLERLDTIALDYDITVVRS